MTGTIIFDLAAQEIILLISTLFFTFPVIQQVRNAPFSVVSYHLASHPEC